MYLPLPISDPARLPAAFNALRKAMLPGEDGVTQFAHERTTAISIIPPTTLNNVPNLWSDTIANLHVQTLGGWALLMGQCYVFRQAANPPNPLVIQARWRRHGSTDWTYPDPTVPSLAALSARHQATNANHRSWVTSLVPALLSEGSWQINWTAFYDVAATALTGTYSIGPFDMIALGNLDKIG